MAARKKKIVLSEAWKEKIRTSLIINRMVKHFDGELELTNSQIKVAEILLKKVVPDLKSIEMSGSLEVTTVDALKELDES